MSALPKQVRDQIAKADRLAKELAQSQRGESPAPPAPPDSSPPVSAAPPPPVPPVVPPSEPPASGSESSVATGEQGVEHKYKVLQGKYNAEVPRLTRQLSEQGEELRQLREQLTATQNLLASLNGRQSAPPADATVPPSPKRYVKDEEIKEYGADTVDFLRRIVREENESLLPEMIDRRVRPLVQRTEEAASTASAVRQHVVKDARAKVLELLDQQVPSYIQLNNDPDFLAWLDEVDPFAGQQRGHLLREAYASNDGPRVVAFFKGFLKENAAISPPTPPTPPAATPAPQGRLEELVAPGTPKAGAPAVAPDGSGKRVIPRAEIAQFYNDVRAGKYRSKPDDQKKLEAEIFAAQREGRVR